MATEKVIQIAVNGGETGWGGMFALTASGKIFLLDVNSMKKPTEWRLIDSPDFDTNVILREDQEG